MAGMYGEGLLARLEAGARSLLPEWGLSPEARVSLLNISENATFRADDPAAGAPIVIRVHRPGYHTRAEIASELAWIAALREAGIVTTPAVLQRSGGGQIAAFDLDGRPREAVAFAFMPGEEPSPEDDLAEGFRELGAISARLHAHARDWQRPAGFARKIWDFDTTVGRTPHWGDWRAGLGLTGDGRAILERAAAELERRLAAYGTGPGRFGLIHADLRLANLLVEDGRIAVIDFDDCGFGWYGFDFAAAVSFLETDLQVPTLMEAWVAGYRSVAPLSDADAAMLPTFVMLRRLQLAAWVASHAETPTAQEMGSGYTDGTCALAERFLAEPAP